MSIYKARALEVAAKALENEIYRMRREAEQHRADARRDEKLRDLKNIWKYVQQHKRLGRSEDAARNRVANEMNIDRETVDWWMARANRQNAKIHKWRRDRQIFLMAHSRSNTEIAELFQLHPVTVSKIIREQLKRRHTGD